MKAIEQYFPVVLFIMLYRVVLSRNENFFIRILKKDSKILDLEGEQVS